MDRDERRDEDEPAPPEDRFEPAATDEETAARLRSADEEPPERSEASEASKGDIVEQEQPWVPDEEPDDPEFDLETPVADALEQDRP